jgi:hypothetical protein
MAKKVVQNPVTPLKSIIIVHHFPDKERKSSFFAKTTLLGHAFSARTSRAIFNPPFLQMAQTVIGSI